MTSTATILLVEDEAPLRKVMASFLRSREFRILEAGNGMEALAAVRQEVPDLILSDITMDQLDGIGLLNGLRKDPRTATIPVIFITGLSDPKSIRQGMGSGADDYLTKPFAMNDLLVSIQARLEKQRLVRQAQAEAMQALSASINLSLPHELLTPLSGILGMAQLIQSESAEQSHIQAMATEILENGNRLREMVEKFLLFAQINIARANPEESQQLSSRQTECADLQLMQVAIGLAERYQRASDLQLECQSATVAMDCPLYQRAVSEILSNAFRYSPAGSPVKVRADVQENFYVIAIEDRGSGLDPVEISRVGAFMQFNRRFMEQQGTGMGLAIAKGLLEIHRGSLQLQSERGKGLRAILKIPVVPSLV